MASFEVAELGPTPLFESQALCGIFDICLCACMCVDVLVINMLLRYVYKHVSLVAYAYELPLLHSVNLASANKFCF